MTRLLIVEDDEEYVNIFHREFDSSPLVLEFASSFEEAAVALEEGTYDAIICDLRIPSGVGTLDEDVAHGRAILTRALRRHQGTPILSFSAYGTVPLLKELLRENRKEDCFGSGTAQDMLDFRTKDEFPACLDFIRNVDKEVHQLSVIDVSCGIHQVNLSPEQDRVIRICARRLNATVVHVSPLAGGLSGARVLRLRLERDGLHVGSIVAKIGELERVLDEHRKVEALVAPVLEPGAHPGSSLVVRAGAGPVGGVFYRLADGFEQTLFEVMSDESIVRPVLLRLKERLEPWRAGAPVQQMSLQAIRESLVGRDEIPVPVTLADETMTVSARQSTIHGDLHIFNVLVSGSAEPILIDFGAVRPNCSSIDPVTLELSPIFHPDAVSSLGAWPTAEQASHWDDLTAYVQGSPVPTFVNACRQWAFDVAAGDREVYASLYAYGLRQLKFSGTRHDVARALIDCARRRLEA